MPGVHMHADSQLPAEKSVDSCKDMKCCTMCAAAYVEPLSRSLMPVRVAFAVRYHVAAVSLAEAPVRLTLGIPITV